MSSVPPELQALLDKQAVAEVIYRYCQACDHQDEAALRDCFHPDATHDHAGFVGPTADWIPAALQWLAGRTAITHMVLNPLILVEGDDALSSFHFLAFNQTRAEQEVEEVIVKGRYIDRLVRHDGAWKIMHRIGIHDLEDVRRVAITERLLPAGLQSGHWTVDPYHAALSAFRGAR